MEMECVECGNIQEAKLKTIYTTMGLKHYYLECDRCYVKTTSYVTDKKLEKMIKANARIRDGRTASDEELDEWEEVNDAIKLRMDELTDKNKF